jgi:hypothetical protein
MTHGLNHQPAVLYTRGLAAAAGRGGGGRGRRGRGGQSNKPRRLPRVIKCDKCGYEFPAEVNERILVEHITKFHMRERQQQQQLQQHERLKPALSPQRPLPPVSLCLFQPICIRL